MGPITTAIHKEFFAIVNGIKPDRFDWLTAVKVPVAEPVGV
jgi:branched-chain amino acid aminotransferase